MKVYIAGKITGDADYRAKFKRAEDRLREEGHTVINPAVLPAGLDPADYGRICFAMLDSADAVAFLGDFGESQGAKLEFEYCKYAKKKIIHLPEEDERAVTFWTLTSKPGLYKRIIQTNISKPDGGKPKPGYLKKVIEEEQKEMAAKCRKEVVEQLQSLLAHCKAMRESGELWVRDCEALDVAIAALRGPTREQVEKMRGEWVNWEDGVCCSICEAERPTKSGTIKFSSRLMRFCPYCGSPMTDEAVDIVMRRLEALKDEID